MDEFLTWKTIADPALGDDSVRNVIRDLNSGADAGDRAQTPVTGSHSSSSSRTTAPRHDRYLLSGRNEERWPAWSALFLLGIGLAAARPPSSLSSDVRHTNRL